jgi:hypothetical protein
MKDYPEKKASHSDTMGVIFPYFWFFDVFFTYTHVLKPLAGKQHHTHDVKIRLVRVI